MFCHKLGRPLRSWNGPVTALYLLPGVGVHEQAKAVSDEAAWPTYHRLRVIVKFPLVRFPDTLARLPSIVRIGKKASEPQELFCSFV